MDIANVELNIKVEATETESQDQDGTFDCEGAMLGEAEVKQERSSDGLTNGGDGSSNTDPKNHSGKCIYEAEKTELRNAMVELTKRNSILEDFIMVEFGDKFDKFVQQRERLINVMGLSDSELTILDGARNPKFFEVIELMRMMKNKNGDTDTSDSGMNNSATVSGSSKIPSNKPISNIRASKKPKLDSDLSDISGDEEDEYKTTKSTDDNQRVCRRICPICSSIMHQRVLRAHLMFSHKNGKLSCPGCRRSFESITDLNRHLKQMHKLSRTEYYMFRKMNNASYRELKQKMEPWLTETVKSAATPTEEQFAEFMKGKTPSAGGTPSSSRTDAGVLPKTPPPPIISSNPPVQLSSDDEDEDDDDKQDLDEAVFNIPAGKFPKSKKLRVKRVCPICPDIVRQNLLEEHLLVKHKECQVPCPVCQKHVPRKMAASHLRRTHKDLTINEITDCVRQVGKSYDKLKRVHRAWLKQMVSDSKIPTGQQLYAKQEMAREATKARRKAKQQSAILRLQAEAVQLQDNNVIMF